VIAQNIAFGAIAAAMVIAALRVVTTQNVVHAALYLVVVLAGAAGLFILLAAEFMAVVQVIVYIGAIVVLFLFGIMLTRARVGKETGLDNEQRGLSLAVALLLLGVLGFVLVDAFGDTRVAPETVVRTGEVGIRIFETYMLQFQAVGFLLLATLVGAIVLARRD
jgi:NADH-quinone oxidoreductase subunit J